MHTMFGPLNVDACMYFYVISVFFGFISIFIALSAVIFAVTNYSKLNRVYVMQTFFALFNTTFAYFMYRLFNTMCTKSLA